MFLHHYYLIRKAQKTYTENKRRLTLEVLQVMMNRGMTPNAFVKIEIFLKHHSYVIIFVRKNEYPKWNV